jgi:uncharacterized protein (TIGR02246 family)
MEPFLYPKSLSDYEAAIRALEAAYDRAWNARNLEALLACMTDNPAIMDPRGVVSRGRDEIRQMLSPFFVSAQTASKHKTEIVNVEFVTPDVAVVDGRAHIEGIVIEQELVAADFVHRFVDIVVRHEGQWRIAHVRACPLQEQFSRGTQ